MTSKKPAKPAKTQKSFAGQLTARATSSIGGGLGVIAGATGAVTSGRKSGAVALPVATAPLSLIIPTPPSLDAMFGNQKGKGKGRYPTPLYKNWQIMAAQMIMRQAPKRFDAPVVILAQINRKSTQADIDNRPKAVLDILKTVGVYSDDKIVTGIAFIWGPTIATSRLLVVPAQGVFKIQFHPYDETGSLGSWFLLGNEEEEDHGH